MLIPTMIYDNFYKEPEKVVSLSKTFSYSKDDQGRYPGERTQLLHEIDYGFFSFTAEKILALMFPNNWDNLQFTARAYFQRISKKYPNQGWIHRDIPYEFTAIVYLSKHTECGTSIFDTTGSYPITENLEEKKKGYKDVKLEKEKDYLLENNKEYNESIKIKSKFNRIIIFDSYQSHGAHGFIEDNIKEDRLTLIYFFDRLVGTDSKCRFHGAECQRM